MAKVLLYIIILMQLLLVYLGFRFVINPYLPMILCLTFCTISAIISLKFKEIPIDKTQSNSKNQNYFKNFKRSFNYIFKSNRLKSLLLFCGVFYGFINLLVSLRTSLLQDINFPAQYIGITIAILGIFSGFASSKQEYFHKKLRNKLLGKFAIYTVISVFICGIVVVLNIKVPYSIIIILSMYVIQYIIKGVYFTLNRKYLSSFTTADIRNKIYSANNLLEAVFGTIITFISSRILLVTNTAYCMIILSISFLIIFILLIKYMKTRLGLKPEEYKKSDIPVEVK